MHESENRKWSCSVVSDSSRPQGLQPTRLLRPWDFPGKSTGVGCALSLFGALHPLLTEREESDFYWNNCLSGINAVKGRLSWICSSVSLVWHPRPERTFTAACHWHSAWYYKPPSSPPPRWMTSSPPQSRSPSWTSAETVHRGMLVTVMVPCSAPHMHVWQQRVPHMLGGWRGVGLPAMTMKPRMTWDMARLVLKVTDLWANAQGINSETKEWGLPGQWVEGAKGQVEEVSELGAGKQRTRVRSQQDWEDRREGFSEETLGRLAMSQGMAFVLLRATVRGPRGGTADSFDSYLSWIFY